MVNNLTVAWAIPVKTIVLGAQLEAYVENKATISVFKIRIQHAQTDSPLARLPTELVDMVADNIRLPSYRKHKKHWQAAVRCCYGNCTVKDHIGSDAYQECRTDFYKDIAGYDLDDEMDELSDDELDFELADRGVGESEHEDRVKQEQDWTRPR